MPRARPGKTGRKNDPAGARSRLLDVAARSFQCRGYAGTSTQDIVSLSGMSPGALHHHFRTKKDLGLAVIAERVASELNDTWISQVGSASSARAGILGVFRSVADTLDEKGSVTGCPVGNLALELSLSDTDLRDALAKNYEAWISAIEDKIASDQRSGSALYTRSPRELAELVVAVFTGAMTLAKVQQNGAPLRSAAGQLDQMLGS